MPKRDRTAKTPKRWPYVVLATGIGVLLVFVIHSVITGRNENGCQQLPYEFSQEYRASVKPHINVAFSVGEKLVRDYESIQTDFALKFETICRDFSANRISKDVYNCRRSQADKALDGQRQLMILISGKGDSLSATAGDSARNLMSQALAHLQSSVATECRQLSLRVIPDTVRLRLPIANKNPLVVKNIGPDTMHWYTAQFPEDRFYMDRVQGGPLEPDHDYTAMIVATPMADTGTHEFWVLNNKRDSARVVLKAQSAQLVVPSYYTELQNALDAPDSTAINLAMSVADSTGSLSAPVKLAATGDLLYRWGRFTAAITVLDSLRQLDPSVSKTQWYASASERAAQARKGGTIAGPVLASTVTPDVPWTSVDSIVFTEVHSGTRRLAAVRPDGWYSVTGLPAGTYKGQLWYNVGGDSTSPRAHPLESWDASAKTRFVVGKGAVEYASPGGLLKF